MIYTQTWGHLLLVLKEYSIYMLLFNSTAEPLMSCIRFHGWENVGWEMK